MGRPQVLHDASGIISELPGVGILLAHGTTVPADAAAGYAPGCVFIHTDGADGDMLYVNEGSVTSCDFNAIEVTGNTIAAKTITALTLDATAVTATGAEINDALDISAQDKMAPSTVIDATVEQYVSSVRREGNLIKTEILIDLTGAKSVATDKDIIGDTGACHFGQITTAINGTIVCGQMTCLEVPAGGADDIDLYMASVGTGAYDADGSALTNAASLITKGGAWALSAPGAATAMTAAVTANYYLYLLSGEAAAGTYTAGKFLIELWGLPA